MFFFYKSFDQDKICDVILAESLTKPITLVLGGNNTKLVIKFQLTEAEMTMAENDENLLKVRKMYLVPCNSLLLPTGAGGEYWRQCCEQHSGAHGEREGGEEPDSAGCGEEKGQVGV